MKNKSVQIFSLFLILFSSTLFAQKKSTISGQVIDSVTGEPVFYVNVFLENTTEGTTTDAEGFFSIRNIPPGIYNLIVQHIGYEIKVLQVHLLRPDSLKYNILIKPRVIAGKELHVFANRPSEWKKNLEKFTKIFIGTDRNAQKARIENPQVIDFFTDSKTNTFRAEAHDVILVNNQALGYRVHIILRSFTFSETGGNYRIHTHFELLTPRDENERREWGENRRQTFSGSLKHFLSALARDKLDEEGFEIYGANYYLSRDKSWIRKFYFDGTLRIVYRKKHVNYISLEKKYALIDRLGNLLTPLAITKSGEWYNERIADLLPWDYHPNAENE